MSLHHYTRFSKTCRRSGERERPFSFVQFREVAVTEMHRDFYPAKSAMGSRGDVNARSEVTL